MVEFSCFIRGKCVLSDEYFDFMSMLFVKNSSSALAYSNVNCVVRNNVNCLLMKNMFFVPLV